MKDFSRICNIMFTSRVCYGKYTFHKVKFSIGKAFFIVFEMGASTKGLSAGYVAVRFGVAEKTTLVHAQGTGGY